MGSYALTRLARADWVSPDEGSSSRRRFLWGEPGRSIFARMTLQEGVPLPHAQGWSMDHFRSMEEKNLELARSLEEGGFTVQRSELLDELLSKELVTLLFQAIERIREIFGHETVVVVEAVEFDDGDRQVVAGIETRLQPEDALGLMDRFDREWWLDSSPRAENQLIIDLEYK